MHTERIVMKPHKYVTLKKEYISKEALKEKDILILQELFWQAGEHYLKVTSVEEGRNLVLTFLNSLYYYKKIACLTVIPGTLPLKAQNLLKLLKKEPFKEQHVFDTEDFLLNQFHFDFVWIEVTQEIMLTPWFKHFEQKVFEYKLAHNCPIIFMQYKRL